MSAKDAKQKIPVTVVTGFLGAGKTTFVNYILNENHGKKIAVIENEFGEVGVDDELVSSNIEAQEEIFEMNNGCLCCTVRGDLIRILTKLVNRKKKLDAVLVETTGLADPAPVAQTFFGDEDIRENMRLDAILTVVDCKHIMQHLDEKKADGITNESVEQVAFADKILLNKVDLVDAEEKAAVRRRIHAINATADIFECERARAPLDALLGISGFDLNRVIDIMPSFLEKVDDHDHSHGHGHGHEHTEGEDCAVCDEVKEGHGHGGHGHGEHEHKEGEDCEVCDEGAAGGHGHGAKKHKHAKHTHHDDGVGSVGIRADGNLDMKKLNEWLSQLLQDHGNDIYRAKGVLSIHGTNEKYVFQGVHHQLEMSWSKDLGAKPWQEGEKRTNKLCFIGKKITDKRKELEESFKSCVVSE